jgi:hypothetical protein
MVVLATTVPSDALGLAPCRAVTGDTAADKRRDPAVKTIAIGDLTAAAPPDRGPFPAADVPYLTVTRR